MAVVASFFFKILYWQRNFLDRIKHLLSKSILKLTITTRSSRYEIFDPTSRIASLFATTFSSASFFIAILFQIFFCDLGSAEFLCIVNDLIVWEAFAIFSYVICDSFLSFVYCGRRWIWWRRWVWWRWRIWRWRWRWIWRARRRRGRRARYCCYTSRVVVVVSLLLFHNKFAWHLFVCCKKKEKIILFWFLFSAIILRIMIYCCVLMILKSL